MYVRKENSPKQCVKLETSSDCEMQTAICSGVKVQSVNSSGNEMQTTNSSGGLKQSANSSGDNEQTANGLKKDLREIVMTSDLATKSNDDAESEDGNEHKSVDSTKKLFYEQCDVCLKYFSSWDKFTRHKWTHLSEFACKLCGKTYPTGAKLFQHQKTHKEDTKCSVCGKRFTTIKNMQIHARVHTGEKPFSCQCCGRKFSDQSNRNRHYRFLHTDECQKSEKRYLDEFSSQVKESGIFSYKFI